MSKIKVDGSKCCGCRLCQLICSVHHFNVTNPKKSRLKIIAKFPMPTYEIVVCNQCGVCKDECPTDAIFEDKDKDVYKINPEVCENCGTCVDVCPQHAIFIHKDIETPFFCDLCGMCVKYCPTNALEMEV